MKAAIRDTKLCCVALVVLFLGASACDDVVTVRLSNQSSAVVIYRADAGDVTLEPGDEVSIGHLPRKGLTLKLEASDGSIIFSGVVPRDVLETLEYDLIVNDEGLRLPRE